ncbi:hypothetical protein BDW59DRAFT_166031 [Aspergillus cavernicola]|uniref:Peptidase S9 prolyl oligopeptidase catalytic domain-containing protein n=1 Tax=Aspergillus cavernicola TaxID=176166 RepID=A0ABR4HPA5_9EURO
MWNQRSVFVWLNPISEPAYQPYSCVLEAVWGADPLEYWGGFKNLSYDEGVGFNSPLANDGIVRWGLAWANVTNSHSDQSRAELVVSFPDVNWGFLQSVYGWSALQYQAWVRGYLHLNGSYHQTVAIFMDGILEFSVDGRRHFGGDFYSYRRVPLILRLAPGEHVIELRLVRDVRALGGEGDPTIHVVFETEIRHELLTIDERSLLMPEATAWKLGSDWASVDVQNNAANWVEIHSISSPDFPLAIKEPLHVAPYQTRPVAFRFAAGVASRVEFPIDVHYTTFQGRTLETRSFRVKFVDRSLSQPQRLTYLHPASIVSYAILRPPPSASACVSNQSDASLPVIIGLHGAGLDADSVQVREMMDAAYGICAWILFPSGVTSWSGDDWHTWGAADIRAAINAISHWMDAVSWTGPGILADDWIAIGHSNGGQGVWFLTTHHPDNVIAATPVSGYSSIENYVSYNMWQDSEPLISSILHRSRFSFKHELLLENTAGIPILQQHGSDDTNVPAYHSRLMHKLLEETNWPSEYVELPSKGHWFDGIMTTAPLLKFYDDALRLRPIEIPSPYTINVPSSGDMTSKGGIFVDQLQSPDIMGRLHVKKDTRHGVWHLKTQNIHRFHLSAKICQNEIPTVLVLDETDAHIPVDPRQCGSTWYVRDGDGRWMSSKQTDWQSLSQRYGRQVGSMDAILRTDGAFTINICSAGIEETALQISHNLLQYFAADARITSQCGPSSVSSARGPGDIPGNAITLSLGNELSNSTSLLYPIRVTDEHIILYKGCSIADSEKNIDIDSNENCHRYILDHEPGMGAVFLRPLDNEGLELVVWGADMDGLEQAARLVPTLTGAGQPEFFILSDSCRWRGHAGLYAAGHFDKFWQISMGSYISNGI